MQKIRYNALMDKKYAHLKLFGTKTQLFQIILGFVTCAFPTFVTATPGFHVQQTLVHRSGQKTTEAKLTWQIGKRRFRLESQSQEANISFLFNGRTFYVCTKPIISQNFAGKNANTAKLLNGFCQEASSDYMAKFFLNPYLAITHFPQHEGLKSQLKVPHNDLKITGKIEKPFGIKCVNFVRNLEIIETTHRSSITENFCNATEMKWRETLHRETTKSLMRSRNLTLNRLLALDLKKLAGFSAFTSLKIHYNNNKKSPISIDVTLVKIEKVPTSKVSFKLPYTVISSLDTLAVEPKKKSPSSKYSTEKTKNEFVPNLFLKFMIGSSPAASLMQARPNSEQNQNDAKK